MQRKLPYGNTVTKRVNVKIVSEALEVVRVRKGRTLKLLSSCITCLAISIEVVIADDSVRMANIYPIMGTNVSVAKPSWLTIIFGTIRRVTTPSQLVDRLNLPTVSVTLFSLLLGSFASVGRTKATVEVLLTPKADGVHVVV